MRLDLFSAEVKVESPRRRRAKDLPTISSGRVGACFGIRPTGERPVNSAGYWEVAFTCKGVWRPKEGTFYLSYPCVARVVRGGRAFEGRDQSVAWVARGGRTF